VAGFCISGVEPSGFYTREFFSCLVKYEDIALELEAFLVIVLPPVKTYGGCVDSVTCIK
jgi:hypothetical protein